MPGDTRRMDTLISSPNEKARPVQTEDGATLKELAESYSVSMATISQLRTA